MAGNLAKKRLSRILLTYLVFAIPVSLAFSQGESFCIDNMSADRLDSGAYLTLIDNTADWQTESTTNINRTRRYSSSSLHNRLLRVFTFAGICIVAVYFTGSRFQIIKKENAFFIKNNIPLKLRI